MSRLSARLAVWTLSGLLVALGAGAGSLAENPIPRFVKFTGVVAGSHGPVDLTFAFYADEASETPLWTETQRVTVEETGHFAVYLGASRPESLPADLFATGEARWLGVRVEGQAEQPRVVIVSVPYALKAADAETVGGKPLSAFVLAGSTTGTAADGLTYVNPQAPKTGLSAAGLLPQASNGTPGYLGLFTSTTDLGNSVIYQNGTSIGVGTTTPAAPFHSVTTAAPEAFFDVYNNSLGALPVVFRAARGTPASPSAVQTDDILGGLAVRGYGATAFSSGRGQVMYKAAENWTDAAQGTYLQFTTTPTGSASWAERLRITPAGNIGIGTPTPAQLLSVAGTIESTTGGVKFPDGTTQTTAARSGAGNNDGFGTASLVNVTTGTYNAAFGEYALSADTTGYSNSASGAFALTANTSGNYNAASGIFALAANTTGSQNTASGALALYANTTGSYNTASGFDALQFNTAGVWNTASGYQALAANTTGDGNTAMGDYALFSNTTGGQNTASGASALYSNTTGSSNVAIGETAGYNLTSGNVNIAVGYEAGLNLTTGRNDVDIGNQGVAGEGYTIRIGDGQTRTFIAGIRGVTTGSADAIPVVIDSTGQLGTVSSSRRVKDDIADMAGASSGLLRLRPVTFHDKSDQNPAGRTLQYGLIAEEVAEVYPGLVARSADGQIETVLYQFLPPMLLNEYQKQERTIEAQQRAIEALRAQVAALTRVVAALSDRKQ